GLNPNANGAGLYGEGKVGVYAKSTGNYYSGMFVGGAGVSVEGGLGVTGIVTAAAFSGNGSGLTGITAETLAPDINVVTTGNVSSTASVAYAGAVTGLNPNANGAGLYGEGKVGVYAKSTGNYYSGMFVGGTGVSVEGGLGVTGIVTAAAFSGSVNADTVDGFHASATATDNNLLPLNDNGQFELVKSYGGALIVVSNGHDNGIGVQGEGGAYGGEFSALSADGIGVYGTSPSYGGYFHSTGATGQGVYAKADGADGVGVSGEAIGANGVGVSGIASATGSVLNYGGFFVAKGDAGEGVSGNATGADGQGVSGFATGANGIAVYGQTIQDAGYAGYFKGGKGISVEGNAFVTGILTAGAFETTGIISSSASAVMAVTGITSDNNGICVYGHATSHAMSSYNTHGETTYNGYGGFFTTPIGTGVYGRSYTGGYGVRGEAQGSSVGGYFTSTGSNGIYVNTISSNSYSGYFTGGLGLASTGTIEVTGASGISIVIDNAFTPSGTTDVRGKTGQICWDEDYIYVKTAAGWRRTQYGATW
ncbi:MAG: hypothetical protein NT099_00255, partial [Candidatus Saganbacteria bacterium]|nr:hypothetical protein [Candidatus Saganbacteria bacterium]